MNSWKSRVAKLMLPATAILVAILAAAWAGSEPGEAADSATPVLLAQAKADKGKAATAGQQNNPGGAGTGKGTQCPPGKKATFVASRGKGAGTVECQ